MRRRRFLKTAGLALSAAAMPRRARSQQEPPRQDRPNILWISTEDISPDLGCYGDPYAETPQLDAFASQGVRYEACFTHMGVCAPARSGIITGMFPTRIGTNHMRCRGVPPPQVRCFTEYLRAAGYYCSNHSKTDYQFAPPDTAWTVQGGSLWWRGRQPGQPFFTVINYGGTHESRARSKPSDRLHHDPAKATLPPYYPDTPVVRRDWAKYYDNITALDGFVARVLADLEKDGLADDTIVWFWGDHGRGLPRAKRWIYDSGTRVPLLVRVPPKWRTLARPDRPEAAGPGSVCDELVLFVDFAPTVLSLAGVTVPDHVEGQAFLGPQRAEPRQYIYGARDRVDESIDIIRCVRDQRFKYIRNFLPHLPRSLDVAYMNQMPTMQEMRRLFAEGKLQGPQLQYFRQPKAIEELYDTRQDPHEVHNLAADPAHRDALERLRAELFDWMRREGDFGMLPEPEFDALKRPGDRMDTTAAPGVRPRQDGDRTLVELASATPGASIAYRLTGTQARPDVDGIVKLATQATCHGPKPWPRKDGANVSGWRNSQAWLSWDTGVIGRGNLPVHVIWACGGRESSRYIVELAGQRLEGRSTHTGGWDRFQVVKLGEVEIPKQGKYTLALKPVPKEGVFQMDLQAVVLGGTDVKPLRGLGAGRRWEVYARPVPLLPGQDIQVKACRLGFRDSKTVTYAHGEPPVAPQEADGRPHWRGVVDASGVVARALALKQLDGQGAKALAAYEKAVGISVLRKTETDRDPPPSVRWWAVVAIHQGHDRQPVRARTRQEAGPYLPTFRKLLEDESGCVRVAAAQALCEWGEQEKALPVLVDVLKNHPLASGRHFAANALYLLGEAARPALEAVRAGARSGGYCARTCRNLLAQWGEG